jgi:Sulfotransferase family
MSSPDWVQRESVVAALLPRSGVASARAQLLATLADYSGAAIREARTIGAIVPSAADCTEALEWLLRPVFICGHHRSGTTLLQNLLDGHPQLVSLPSEGAYFSSFAYVARRAPTDSDMNRFAAEWITRCVDPNFAPHFRLGVSDERRAPAVDFARALFGWREALRSRVSPELAPLLALIAAYRSTAVPTSHPQGWVEKTPQNERYASRFAPLAGARFIQIVRDPRATFASLREVYRANGIASFDAAEHARAIGRSLRLAVENRNRLRHRYLVVRYEDLAERTEQELERVRQFLGIAPDPVLLLPTASGSAVRANSSFGRGAVGVIEPPRRPELPPSEDAAVLGVYAANAARPFDYAISAPGPIAQIVLRARYSPRHVLRSGRAALLAIMRPLLSRRVDRSH